MTTLVTGATGFIGRHVARRLMERGERVRFFCRGESRLDTELRNSTCIDVAQGDMRDKRSLERAVAAATRVIHLAAAMSGSEEYFQAATVQGSRDILEVATTAGVRRFVYVSSMSVYDFSKVPEGGLVDEESPLETQLALRNDYARAKSQADAIARQH